MEMHQIRYFLAVCSEHNFTRAAKICHVSQPSLTRAIKLLEAELGGALFRRERAQSDLTELGEIVRPNLQQVWEQSFAAVTNAQEFSATSRSRLRIGVMSTIDPRLPIDLLARTRTQHDAIEFEIVDGPGHMLEAQLGSGHLAAAIICRPLKADARLAGVALLRERIMIAIPSGHRLAGRRSLRVGDLAGECVIRRSGCEHGERIARILRQHRNPCSITLDSLRDDFALALVARGLGLALLPEHSIGHPGVVARPLAEPEYWREIGLFTSKDHPRSEGLETLLREARQGVAAWERRTGGTSERRRRAK